MIASNSLYSSKWQVPRNPAPLNPPKYTNHHQSCSQQPTTASQPFFIAKNKPLNSQCQPGVILEATSSDRLNGEIRTTSCLAPLPCSPGITNHSSELSDVGEKEEEKQKEVVGWYRCHHLGVYGVESSFHTCESCLAHRCLDKQHKCCWTTPFQNKVIHYCGWFRTSAYTLRNKHTLKMRALK